MLAVAALFAPDGFVLPSGRPPARRVESIPRSAMQPRTREVLDYLTAAERELNDAVAAVPEADRVRRPGPDRWSVAEILEHLSLVEYAIAGMLAQHVEAARGSGVGPERETEPVVPTVPLARLLDRDARLTASARSQPTAGLGWDVARRAFGAARAQLVELLQGADGLALSEVVIQHPLLGPLNVYQWAVFLGAHTRRHAAQVRETAAAPTRMDG